MGIHDGHRARLRERYRNEGLDNFNDINALELLLSYAIPRRDTNELAHALLKRFGNLAGVLDASVEELCQVPGIGEHAAILVHMVTALNRKYMISRADSEIVANSSHSVGEFLLPYFYGLHDEVVYLLCMDAKGKVLDCRALFRGTANAVAISLRKVVETALMLNATSVVMAHNHLSGVAAPSTEDIATTHSIATALSNLGIYLLDHIVVADNDFVSMMDSGLMPRL